MRKKKFLSALFTVLLVGLAATAACAATLEHFTLGLPGDAKALDPHQSVDNMSFAVLKHLNEPLVMLDGKTKELVPVLAEKWERLDDKTYKPGLGTYDLSKQKS